LFTVIAVGLLGIIVVGSLLRRRRAGSTAHLPPPETYDLDAPRADAARLEEVADPEAVVLVPLPISGTRHSCSVLRLRSRSSTQSGLTLGEKGARRGPLSQLVTQIIAAGGSEATRRAQHGIDSGRIVALAPRRSSSSSRDGPSMTRLGPCSGWCAVTRGD
jgi:hypothetical protein